MWQVRYFFVTELHARFEGRGEVTLPDPYQAKSKLTQDMALEFLTDILIRI